MALKIEDGSGVADANSYGVTDGTATFAAARSYAVDRGIVLCNADDAKLTAYLILATDYLESKKYKGSQVDSTQPLSFPRQGLYYSDGTVFPEDELPDCLLKALYQLCIEQQSGVKLLPTVDRQSSGGFIKREKIDVFETEYSEQIGTTLAPIMPAVDALLAGIIQATPSLRAVRV
jgi:hypothetical protein